MIGMETSQYGKHEHHTHYTPCEPHALHDQDVNPNALLQKPQHSNQTALNAVATPVAATTTATAKAKKRLNFNKFKPIEAFTFSAGEVNVGLHCAREWFESNLISLQGF